MSAIRDDDPVIFMEPKRVYRAARGDVPETEYAIPLGQANVVKEGTGVTVIAYVSHCAVPLARSSSIEEGMKACIVPRNFGSC